MHALTPRHPHWKYFLRDFYCLPDLQKVVVFNKSDGDIAVISYTNDFSSPFPSLF